MSKVLVEEGNLTNIANAIRTKSNTTATYKPGEMAAAISNLSTSTYVPTDEDLTFRNCQSTKLFAENQFSWLLDNYKDKKIRFTGNCYYMADTFYTSKREDLSNVIFEDCRSPYSVSLEGLLSFAKTKYPPKVKNCEIVSLSNAFQDAKDLKNLPSFENSVVKISNNKKKVLTNMCADAYSLEDVNFDISKGMELKDTRYSYDPPYYGEVFKSCLSLKSIVFSLPMVQASPVTKNNQFKTFVDVCPRLRRLKFKNYLPSLQMKSQVIEIDYMIGYVNKNAYIVSDNPEYFLTDKEIKDDATYQALKNDPDAWTRDQAYSFYNHDSAVETINSLPDTSAFLAEQGGTNTIKFRGNLGAKTDGGAINTMTAEEIAIAAAKGWTVAFK